MTESDIKWVKSNTWRRIEISFQYLLMPLTMQGGFGLIVLMTPDNILPLTFCLSNQ